MATLEHRYGSISFSSDGYRDIVEARDLFIDAHLFHALSGRYLLISEHEKDYMMAKMVLGERGFEFNVRDKD